MVTSFWLSCLNVTKFPGFECPPGFCPHTCRVVVVASLFVSVELLSPIIMVELLSPLVVVELLSPFILVELLSPVSWGCTGCGIRTTL